ncbi:MAG: FecR family protein [Ferruginibacter sp.]
MCNDRIWTLLTRKLTGEATSTELKELDSLLSSLNSDKQTVHHITGIWNTPARQDDDFMEATFLAHVERMKDKGVAIGADAPGLEDETITTGSPQKKIFSLKNLALAAVFAVMLSGIWILLSSKTAEPDTAGTGMMAANMKEVTTKKGSRTKLQLPDGSNVWLNAGSRIYYDKAFNGKERVVNLTGEAFFDVVKNPDRPFIIHTSKIDVRVLGTQFNVKAYEEDKTTETSLIRGSVEVFLKSHPSKKYLLHPNEKLVLDNEPVLAPEPRKERENSKNAVAKVREPQVAIKELSYLDDNENVESSWTKNILSFDDEQFSEVAKKMERWYNVTIKFKNKSWEKKFLSGSFESETLDQALAALKFTTGFKFTIDGDKVSIY